MCEAPRPVPPPPGARNPRPAPVTRARPGSSLAPRCTSGHEPGFAPGELHREWGDGREREYSCRQSLLQPTVLRAAPGDPRGRRSSGTTASAASAFRRARRCQGLRGRRQSLLGRGRAFPDVAQKGRRTGGRHAAALAPSSGGAEQQTQRRRAGPLQPVPPHAHPRRPRFCRPGPAPGCRPAMPHRESLQCEARPLSRASAPFCPTDTESGRRTLISGGSADANPADCTAGGCATEGSPFRRLGAGFTA